MARSADERRSIHAWHGTFAKYLGGSLHWLEVVTLYQGRPIKIMESFWPYAAPVLIIYRTMPFGNFLVGALGVTLAEGSEE